MKLPKFIDLHPHYDGHGFAACNEDVALHRRLLDKIDGHLGKVASIASGGEIPFLALLPKATSVLAVDHSYRALASCFMKVILLQTVGLRRMKELFTPTYDYRGEGYEAFLDQVAFTRHYMPPEVAKVASFAPILTPPYYYKSWVKTILEPGEGYKGTRDNWLELSQEEADFISANCDRVTLIHGDFTDLASEAPFDLLYISNMLGHNGRSGAPAVTSLIKMLKPGGYILGTSPEKFINEKSLKEVTGAHFEYGGNPISYIISPPKELQSKGWTHTLHRLEERVA